MGSSAKLKIFWDMKMRERSRIAEFILLCDRLGIDPVE